MISPLSGEQPLLLGPFSAAFPWRTMLTIAYQAVTSESSLCVKNVTRSATRSNPAGMHRTLIHGGITSLGNWFLTPLIASPRFVCHIYKWPIKHDGFLTW